MVTNNLQEAAELKLQPRTESKWQKVLNYKIGGVIPVGLYIPFMAVVYMLMNTGKLASDMPGAVSVMVLYGFILAEIGKRIPILKDIGGAAIMATFVPSYMVYAHLLPQSAIDSVTVFMDNTNFLYVYIAIVIAGSILGMNRELMIKAVVRLAVPLAVGSIVGTGVGLLTGVALGISAYDTLFYILVPIMAGGVGEGAIPLSIGYSQILGSTQGEQFAMVIPAVMLGSLCAIILSGLLKQLGDRRPELTGNGTLLKTGDSDVLGLAEDKNKKPLDLYQMAAGAILAFGFFMLGTLTAEFVGLPGPIVMLFAAFLAKYFGWLPKFLEDGAQQMQRFFVIAVTYPLLLAVGVAKTPWDALISVISPAYFITILVTVLAVVVGGYFAGKWMKMYPVEAAIITSTRCSQGGTGDVAILSAADRMVLMPFAQVSTRLGGAATVTLAIFLLRYLTH
ncbi:malate permease [Paenibacillus polymyxa]|uniref:2-hydroxycarboxylate transporter family protein n=1 Tax=Paenibacillus jamilae TaxID=114136 RepID=UPI0007E932BF|nr:MULTISPECIES: 2-hydroxycarboxylate transporter family protein [Paenibacillus]OBA04862.1 malate permease [Paenibacillus polymyxa]